MKGSCVSGNGVMTRLRPSMWHIARCRTVSHVTIIPTTRLRRLSTAPRVFRDALYPDASQQLTRYLADYLPAECLPPSSLASATGGASPPGHHLVSFPPLLPPSALLPDGTDPEHRPEDAGARRLWA